MGRCSLIVADDSEEIRRSLADILSADYDVVGVVENGQELVDVATDLKPDLLVIDVAMPLLNGLDALAQLARSGSAAKAVIVSAIGDPAYVRRAFQLGAVGYVLKATAAEDLPAALEAALAGRTFTSRGITV